MWWGGTVKKNLLIALTLASGAFALTMVEPPKKGCAGDPPPQRNQVHSPIDWARGVVSRVRIAWQIDMRRSSFSGVDAHQRHTPLSLAEFARQAELPEPPETPSKKL